MWIEVVFGIGGIILGSLLTYLLCRKPSVGTIIFYQLDPDEPPVMTAELNKPVEDFHKYKSVLFKVSHH